MAISWDSFDKIWASTSPLTPYSFSEPNYAQGWNFVGSTPPARQMWDSIQKQNDEKFKYLRDNFGTPNIVTQASQMTDTDKVYVYLGSEAGWNSGHWYYYDEGTSSWADGGVYNSVAFVTDTTLSIAGQPADAKATGDALALKSDLAGCTFTGNVSVNADLSVTGDATIGTDLSVTGVSTLTGNVSAGADVTVVGDVSSANMTTSADATIGGDLSVTGASTLAGNITTSGDISADNISATTNGTVGGNLSVTGISTLTGNINAGADINAVGDVSADNLTTTTNATVGGSLSVAGTSTLTGNVTTNGNINAVGDISSANLITTNATIGGNATVTGDVSCANLTTSADASVGGDLTVTGDSTLADTTVNDLDVNNDLSVAGDSSLTNLSVSGTTALAGTSTAPTPSADDNSTKIATTEYVQTELKPIETKATIDDKRISNIEKLLQGNLYDYQTDTDSAYTKTVPQGAMPYASLEQIGGKTLVWNQLVDYTQIPADASFSNDTHIVNNNDGSITFTKESGGTTVTNWYLVTNLVAGHKFAIVGWTNPYVMEVYPSGQPVIVSDGIYTINNTFLRLRTNETTWQAGDTFTVKPKIADLTLLFGAGNEPSTLDEFLAVFPDFGNATYNAGTLLSAGVTEVVSVGKNLADFSGGAGVPSNTALSNTTKRIFEIGKYVVGLTYNNYYNPPSVTQHSVSGNTITVTNSGNGYGVGIPFNCLGGNSYTINLTQTGGLVRVGWYAEDGTYISGNVVNAYHTTLTAPSGARQGVFVLYDATVNVQATFQNVIIAEGTTATYVPAKAPISYPIPAEIRNIEGYGWSARNAYNYVDFERKVFVKNVDRVDLGTLSFGSSSTTGHKYFYSGGLSDVIKYVAGTNTAVNNIVCDKYIAGSFVDAYNGAFNCIGVGGALVNTGRIAIYDSTKEDMTTAEFKDSLNGVYAYYELATPQEIDISAYLTNDNLIEVESGGTLTFPNSNGNDYRIPIPSSETYMVNLQASL